MKCTRPETKDWHTDKQKLHPCGYCPACRHNDRVQWTFRVHQESREAKEQWFITLTYDQEAIPILGEDGELQRGIFNLRSDTKATLLHEDVQTFLNSVRKAQERRYKELGIKPPEIRYYMVGEYGSKYSRPHYHIIIFNLLSELAQETELEKTWKKGKIETEPLSTALIHYATGYLHEKDDYIKGKQIKPYMSCSKGIGRRYEKKAKDFHKKTLTPFVHYNGHKIPLPRYYINRWFDDEEKEKMMQKANQYLNLENYKFEPRVRKSKIPRLTQSDQQQEYSIKNRITKRKL